MTAETMIAAPDALAAGELRIEFTYLDLTTCTRCLGTDRSLEAALELTREVLAATGVKVEVSKILVNSAEQARALRFVSSPTIRVNGADVALELRESSCGSEACTDGCGDQIACRVWVHRGQEYTEPPPAMIVEAILRQVYGGAGEAGGGAAAGMGAVAGDGGEPDAEPYQLPENLERFYAGKTAAAGQQQACCSPAKQETCCEPGDKAECCGTALGENPGGSCGCQ